MSKKMSDTQCLSFLKKSEELCEKNELIKASDLWVYPTHKERAIHHSVWEHSIDEEIDDGADEFQINECLEAMRYAPYLEKMILNKKTKETVYHSFFYFEKVNEISPIYYRKLHDKPHEVAVMTAKFISLERFNRFFNNATEAKLDNFKCRQHYVPAFVDLLKESQWFCTCNKLAGIDEFNNVKRQYQSTKKPTRKLRDRIIDVLKDAAFYDKHFTRSYDKEHLAIMYDRNNFFPVRVISLIEREHDFSLSDKLCNIFEFCAIMSQENMKAKQIKGFKCFRNMR